MLQEVHVNGTLHIQAPGTARRLGLSLGFLALACIGCDARGGAPANRTAEGGFGYQADQVAPAAAPPAQAETPMRLSLGGSGGGTAGASAVAQVPAPTPVTTERKVIRNGAVRFEVSDTDTAVDAVKSMVTSLGGYVSSEQRDQAGTTGQQATLSCRVPAQRLDEMLAKLKELGKQETVSLTAEDISEQYLDLEVHLRTQKQLEERLRALLERSSNRLSDLLEIEKEIARVRGEIDSMEGRKRFWDNQVAFSTLGVTLHEPRPAVAAAEGGIWATIKGAFGESADNFVRTIAGLISALGALIPLGVALVAAFWFVRFLWRRRRV